jgi:hypothetical protein
MITQAQGLAIFLAIVILGTLLMWLITPHTDACGSEGDRTSYENCLDSY